MAINSWIFERVSGPFSFTEGPAWTGEVVLFTDIPNNRIMRYNPQTGKTDVFREATNEANGLMFDQHGQLYACEGGGRCIARYNADGSRDIIVDRFEGKRLNSPNDLAFDDQGRIWFTDPRYGDRIDDLELDHQSVLRADSKPDGNWLLQRMTFDTVKPNGILISPDQSRLYVAESNYGLGNNTELRAYPINSDGGLGECEILHNFYPHRGIDGMTLDNQGNIVATAGWEQSGPGSMIYVFSPRGRVAETHPIDLVQPEGDESGKLFPGGIVTNCAFGGIDLRTLYVTAGGCLYRAETHRQGIA
jgi:gluconolactonase